MAAYATITDLEARWRPLIGDERTRATALLNDAAVRINSCAPPPALPDGLTDTEQALRLMVSCDMVKRAMLAGAAPGVTQQSQTVGVFSQQATFANPAGDMYLTKEEKKLLGVGRQRVGSFWIGQRPEAEEG